MGLIDISSLGPLFTLSCAPNKSQQHWKILDIFGGMSGIKPRAAGWEARMLPLCFAAPPPPIILVYLRTYACFMDTRVIIEAKKMLLATLRFFSPNFWVICSWTKSKERPATYGIWTLNPCSKSHFSGTCALSYFSRKVWQGYNLNTPIPVGYLVW